MVMIQRGHFIDIPSGFQVTVPASTAKKRLPIQPTGLYITYDYSKAYIQYAGPDADKSYTCLEIPCDPAFLRKFAAELNKFADRIDNERPGGTGGRHD
jgi:hypothetical protein